VKSLIVEDDFASRLVLQTFLSRFGECHIAVNGKEAVEAFQTAVKEGQRYDLICMDIMMPEMDGHTAVRLIREQEEGQGIPAKGVKIIMTTALSGVKEVSTAYYEECDAYLVKPIDLGKVVAELSSLGLAQ
jgi:two-component system chemotaxis response regulator CheY